jgi:hypothetical protein
MNFTEALNAKSGKAVKKPELLIDLDRISEIK